MASEQGLAAKSGTATPNLGIDPRREKRLHLAIPVKVFADPASQDFQTCCTYELSIIGVRLVAPIGITKVGQIIALQRHNRRARYRVVWIGHPDTKEAGQVGVESLEPNNVIWESEIRTKLGKS